MTEIRQFEAKKTDLAETRWVTRALGDVAEGGVRLRVDVVSFTANNITYGLTGDRFGYWQYFPASEDGWGIIPVWGYAEVVESRCDGIDVGERFYGYYPMAPLLDVAPTKVSPRGFMDGAAHRDGLPAVYNDYLRASADPSHASEKEPFRSLIFPLAATAYGLADWLAEGDFHGAAVVGLISASSKTALGTASLLKDRKGARRVVGLTSAANGDIIKPMGLYDDVVSYDDMASLDAAVPHVLIDFAGRGDVTAALHQHLGENMRHTALVGASHGAKLGMADGMIKERSELFFMPGYAAQRIKETGGQFVKDMTLAAAQIADQSPNWLTLTEAAGEADISDLYHTVREGRVRPDQGGIMYFNNG